MKHHKMDKDEKYMIPSIIAAQNILRYLSSYKTHKATLTEISKNLSINKSTCYRLLLTLTRMNSLTYNEGTKTYSLGPNLIVLGQKALEFIDYMPIAKEYLHEAVSLTNSTCALVHRVGDKWAYLAKEEPITTVRIALSVGQRFALTGGSAGKMFLAFADDDDRQQTIKKLGLRKYTDKSIVQVQDFFQELSNIRQVGYAVSIEEHVRGVDGIAAPIADSFGNAQMGILAVMIHVERSPEELAKLGMGLAKLTAEMAARIYP